MRGSQILWLTIFAATVPWQAYAQQQPATTGGRALGLLRSFIDSQLPDPGLRGNQSGQQPQQQLQTGSIQPNRSRAGGTNAGAVQLREAGRLLGLASGEMQELVGSLQDDMYRAPGVRQLLSLAFKVNSDAAVLSRRLTRATDIETLREPLRQLDQDWRTLEYRLGQTPNLGRETLGHLERIRQFESTLASMFEVQTQVDVGQIAAYASEMNTSLRSLLEDIRYEVNDPALANQLLHDGRDTYEQLQRLAQASRTDTSYATLKQEYERLEQEWARYERRLRPVNNRFVQRQVQRINDSVRNLRGLLYLENTNQVSREEMAHTTRLLQGDLDKLLGQVNLKMLTELPGSRRFSIESAADLTTTCQDLLEVIEVGDDIEVLRDVYTYAVDEWQRLATSLQGVSSPQARESLRDVEQSLSELQFQLGVRFDLDRNQATELAAAIVSGARHFQSDTRNFFGRPNRYPRDFQTNSLHAVAQFHAAARDLHRQLEEGQKLQTLKITCDRLASAWQDVTQYVPRFESNERMHLDLARRELTPQVIQMQTLLSL